MITVATLEDHLHSFHSLLSIYLLVSGYDSEIYEIEIRHLNFSDDQHSAKLRQNFKLRLLKYPG